MVLTIADVGYSSDNPKQNVLSVYARFDPQSVGSFVVMSIPLASQSGNPHGEAAIYMVVDTVAPLNYYFKVCFAETASGGGPDDSTNCMFDLQYLSSYYSTPKWLLMNLGVTRYATYMIVRGESYDGLSYIEGSFMVTFTTNPASTDTRRVGNVDIDMAAVAYSVGGASLPFSAEGVPMSFPDMYIV